MGRIFEMIQVDGRKFWTLFDTGAKNTYVVPAVARLMTRRKMPFVFRSAIGGKTKKSNTMVLLEAKIQGKPIGTQAMLVDDIGEDENGKPIEILFGALAMQQWGIRPIPDEERLDLSRYTRTFVEF